MIKKIIFALSIFMAVAVYGQRKNDKNMVTAAAEKLRTAMISGDKKSLESLVLPDLTYGHSDGRVQNVAEFVESLVMKKSNFLTIDITNETVAVVGNTATIRHHLCATTADYGKAPGDVNLDILLVWVKTGKTWKLLARQAVKSPKK